MFPTQLTAASMSPTTDVIGSAPRASADAQFTCCDHGCFSAHAGARPVREMEVTEQPASTSVLQTRDPVNPLPPKTATRGATIALDSESTRANADMAPVPESNLR